MLSQLILARSYYTAYQPDMDTHKLKQLATAKAQVTKLEAAIAAELNSELAGLPARYGFANANAFTAAVKAAAGKRRGRKPGPAKSSAKPADKKRRKRAVITDETRASVKQMVKDGKTGTEIAKALKISLPSVQNIKKALGLVATRKK